MSKRWYLLLGMLWAGQIIAAELPDRYRRWVDEDVYYLISKEDTNLFLALQSDRERDVFVENFWKKFDPIPITPQNEFRDEHYQRLAYVKDHFGLRSDQGRVWMMLGKPDHTTSRGVDNNFYSLEYWEYTRLQVPGLPGDLRLLFYRKWGVGNYVLYSPLFDGIRALLVNRMLDPDKREVQKWLMANMDIDIRQATRSTSTGLSEFQSQDLISRLYWNYEDLVQRFHSNRVETRIVYEGEQTFPVDAKACAIPADPGEMCLDVAVEIPPQGLTFEQVKDRFIARVDLYVKLLDAKKRLIDDRRESLSVDLTEQQLATSKTYSLLYLGGFPAIPGSYTIDVTARDFASGRVGRISRDVEAIAVESSKVSATEPLLAYKFEREESRAREDSPFHHVGYRVYPRVNGTFGPGSNLYFFSAITSPAAATEPSFLPLRFEVLRGDEEKLGFDNTVKRVPGSTQTALAEGFSTSGLAPGSYRLRVQIAVHEGLATLAETPFTISEAPAQNGRFLFEASAEDEAARHETIGVEQMLAGNPDAAAVQFRLAVDFAPWMTAARVNLARAQVLTGEPARALETVGSALKEEPDNIDALTVKAQALVRAGRMPEAFKIAERLLQLAPNSTGVLNYCGELYQNAGQSDRAKELFRKSIELDPDQPDIPGSPGAVKDN